MSDTKTKVSDLLLDFTGKHTAVPKRGNGSDWTYLEVKGEFNCCFAFLNQAGCVQVEISSDDQNWDGFSAPYIKSAARELFKSLINLGFTPF